MHNEPNLKQELTPEQQNPYLARPEDFDVMTPAEAATKKVPGHGQRGRNLREQNKLLREAFAKAGKAQWQGHGQELPTSVDDAGAPHTK